MRQLARLSATSHGGRRPEVEALAPAHVVEGLPTGLLGAEALSDVDLAPALNRSPNPSVLMGLHPGSGRGELPNPRLKHG